MKNFAQTQREAERFLGLQWAPPRLTVHERGPSIPDTTESRHPVEVLASMSSRLKCDLEGLDSDVLQRLTITNALFNAYLVGYKQCLEIIASTKQQEKP